MVNVILFADFHHIRTTVWVWQGAKHKTVTVIGTTSRDLRDRPNSAIKLTDLTTGMPSYYLKISPSLKKKIAKSFCKGTTKQLCISKVFFSYSTQALLGSFGGLSKYLHSLENCLSCQFVKMKGNWPLLTNWNATTELMNEAMANTIPKVHTECLHFYAKTPLQASPNFQTSHTCEWRPCLRVFGYKTKGS